MFKHTEKNYGIKFSKKFAFYFITIFSIINLFFFIKVIKGILFI